MNLRSNTKRVVDRIVFLIKIMYEVYIQFVAKIIKSTFLTFEICL